jgi:hypothetical protein
MQTQQISSIRKYQFKKIDWYRFEQLCKIKGFTVETGINYTYHNLCETENYFLRIMSNDNVIALAYLID